MQEKHFPFHIETGYLNIRGYFVGESRAPDKVGFFSYNFSCFSIKTYVVTSHLNSLRERVLMMVTSYIFMK